MSRPFDLKAFLVSQLRRASYKWPERTKVLQAARIERGLYKCATCLQIFDRHSVQIDHTEPVVPLEGWDNWDGYIARMFCSEDKMSCLCKPCHKSKTYLENELRKQYKHNGKN